VWFGVAGSVAGTRLVTSYLLGAKTLDPVVVALTALVLAIIGGAAAFGPARRALAVEPLDALRHQ